MIQLPNVNSINTSQLRFLHDITHWMTYASRMLGLLLCPKGASLKAQYRVFTAQLLCLWVQY